MCIKSLPFGVPDFSLMFIIPEHVVLVVVVVATCVLEVGVPTGVVVVVGVNVVAQRRCRSWRS